MSETGKLRHAVAREWAERWIRSTQCFVYTVRQVGSLRILSPLRWATQKGDDEALASDANALADALESALSIVSQLLSDGGLADGGGGGKADEK